MLLGFISAEAKRELQINLLFALATWFLSLGACIGLIRAYAPRQERFGACVAAIIIWIVFPWLALAFGGVAF